MERLIGVIRQRYGSFDDCARAIGITASTVASLRNSLLDR
jgi:hypothetical protein